MHNMQT